MQWEPPQPMKKYLLPLIACLFSCPLLAEEFSVETDVVYGEIDGQKLLLDIGKPKAASATLRPAVILVHGGGWCEGNKDGLRWLTEGLAREGYVSFGINYRLMKDGKNLWPAQIDDVQRAVRWIRANAEKYGVDPARI
ncbi:MAG: Carboxylesterase NlhH, partial [Verrucomicrobiota bacterium]